MNRFLIVNPFGIGDVLFTIPLVESIHRNCLGSYIGYLCNKRTYPLIQAHPNIQKVFIFEKDEYRTLWRESKLRTISELFRLLKELKEERFDTVFDLSLAQEYGLFLMLAGINNRIGYNYKGRGIFLTKKMELPEGYCDRHMVEYYGALLELAGIPLSEGLKLSLYIPPGEQQSAHGLLARNGIGERDEFFAMVPAAGASWGIQSFRKQWPKEHFARLAKEICNKIKIKLLLLGSAAERPLCDYIQEKETRCVNMCGKTSLMGLAAILRRAQLLITNDGGPLHIAVCVGIKTVSVFGPVDDKVYGPYPLSSNHIVVKNNSLDCRPCYRRFKLPACERLDCLTGITPEAVFEAVLKVIAQ